jgi:hypothetical protein
MCFEGFMAWLKPCPFKTQTRSDLFRGNWKQKLGAGKLRERTTK